MIINEIKREFEKNKFEIEVKKEISGTNWIAISMTNITREPITCGTPINNLKIRIQPLISGIRGFSQQDGRVDNSHELPIHQHFGKEKRYLHTLGNETASWALGSLLGFDCWGN